MPLVNIDFGLEVDVTHPLFARRSSFVFAVILMTAGLAAPVYAQAPPLPAAAQNPSTSWSYGVRAGLSRDPNQVFFGGQLESPGLSNTGRLTCRPNVVFGIGDDENVLIVNMDVIYYARLPQSDWAFFFGAGPAFVYLKDPAGGSITAGSHSTVVGFQHTKGLFIEYRAGGGFGHDLEMTVGYVLKGLK